MRDALAQNSEVQARRFTTLDQDNCTPIQVAARNKNWKQVIQWAKQYSDTDGKARYGSALLYAVVANQYEAAEALLEAKARDDSYNKSGMCVTCLDFAINNHNPRMVKLLLKHGFKPLPFRDKSELTAEGEEAKAMETPPILKAIELATHSHSDKNRKDYWECVRVIVENYKDEDGKAGYTQALQEIISICRKMPKLEALLVKQGASAPAQELNSSSFFAEQNNGDADKNNNENDPPPPYCEEPPPAYTASQK